MNKVMNKKKLNLGDKVEIGYIPEKIVLTSKSTGDKYTAFADAENTEIFKTYYQKFSDGTGVILPDAECLIPFEGEFLPPEEVGGPNTRLSRGFVIPDTMTGFDDGGDYYVETEFDDE